MTHINHETIAEMKAKVKRLAEESFANHAIMKVAEERWYCKRRKVEGSDKTPRGYWFHLSHYMGVFVLTGDVGDAIWNTGVLVKEIPNAGEDYLLEKLSNVEKEFYPKEVIRHVRQMVEEEERRGFRRPDDAVRYSELIDGLEEADSHGELSPHAAYELLGDANIDDAGEIVGVGYHYAASHYWNVYALQCWARLLIQDGEAGGAR